jgi:L-threonylcarbamoyladenylate synthase
VIDEAIAALRAGQPVVLPTDTVYGLCANAADDEAVRRAYALKGREEKQPSALLAADVDALFECVPEARDSTEAIARALLPGPFTLVVPNPARRFRRLTGDRPETLGVRVPRLEGEAGEVVAGVGAVMATSANLPGAPDPRRLEDVPKEIRRGCSALVDGGELPGIPSTVVDLTAERPEILREGAVPADEALELIAAVTA